MHPAVGDFANKYFYEGILQPIPLPHQSEPLPYTVYDTNNKIEKIIATRRTKFIETTASADGENPKINRNEAETIAQFVATYSKLCEKNGIECNPDKEIGIIVPFRNQIAMVTNEIARLNIPDSGNIIIDTVERFQGSQRDIILYGTTISTPSMMEILSVTTTDAKGTLIDRKLNVAITRARRQMFIFGVPEALQASPLYSALMQEMK
jgi:superfamily I DNA and/or RNA helicase